MKRVLAIFLLIFMMHCFPATAQFYLTGDEPASARWRQKTTDSYRLIYPAGLDSLAEQYARSLEQYKQAVSGSIGYVPNQSYRKPMPVVLHPHNVRSNGSVVWTPRRMDLYTSPSAYAPDAIPWIQELSIHESRHVAQMQFARSGWTRPFHYISGELFAGAAAGLYGNQVFFEGDAVATETALSHQGRGRSGDFLEYQRAAFAAGDLRNFFRWSSTSMKYITPDYYRSGYMLIAGMNSFYSDSLFSRRYYDNIRHPFSIFNLSRTVRQSSGRNIVKTFRTISEGYAGMWEEERAARGPFMPAEQLSASPHRQKEFSNLFACDSVMIATATGVERERELVSIDLKTGKTRTLSAFAAGTSRLARSADGNRLYWSETIPDPRWSMKSNSIIRYYDLKTHKKGRLTRGSRLFNPAPAPDGRTIAATEYTIEGGSAIALIDVDNGNVVRRICAPDSLQILESAWMDGALFVTGLSNSGTGIYRADQGFQTLLAPTPVCISRPWEHDGTLCFSSDRTGVEELYSISPENGEVRQLTNSAFGAKDYTVKEGWLYYSSLTEKGRLLYRTAMEDLPSQKIDFAERHIYRDAEGLSQREPDIPSVSPDSISVSEARPYSKLSHLMKVHSWAPLYFNYDNVRNLSFDYLYDIADLGVTGMFQNDLSSLSGMAGYSFNHEHRGYAQLTYSGLYPVFEGNLYFSESRNSGYVSSYVPLNFSSGGWNRGLVPQLRYRWGFEEDNGVTVSVRGYSMRPAARCSAYPRLGIGAELGYNSYKDRTYAYMYGYLPGIVPQQGLKLTFLAQQLTTKEPSYWGRLTADYAISFAPLEWGDPHGLFYIRNLELILHAEEFIYKKTDALKAGFSLSARLGYFLSLPFETRIGVSFLHDGKNLSGGLLFGISL